MPRFLSVVISIGLSVYAVIDCVQTLNPKALPKAIWLAIIILCQVIGPILWLLFGRTNGRGWGRDDDAVLGPDDDPSFMRDLDRSR
jgi:hypothetical protein